MLIYFNWYVKYAFPQIIIICACICTKHARHAYLVAEVLQNKETNLKLRRLDVKSASQQALECVFPQSIVWSKMELLPFN